MPGFPTMNAQAITDVIEFLEKPERAPRVRPATKGAGMDGTMLWFNEAKDHGFILTDDGERLFAPGEGYVGGKRPTGRCARLPVRFIVVEDGDTRMATQVEFVEDDAPRRARMRHRSPGAR